MFEAYYLVAVDELFHVSGVGDEGWAVFGERGVEGGELFLDNVPEFGVGVEVRGDGFGPSLEEVVGLGELGGEGELCFLESPALGSEFGEFVGRGRGEALQKGVWAVE